jgi:hypothetical protein
MGILKGKGAPTRNTPGFIGDRYIDTDTKNVYKCVFAYKAPFNDPEYEWKPTDDIPVTVEEKPVIKEKPVEEVSEEEVVEEVKVEESPKPNYSNYSNKPRNNYNKQYKK